MATLFEEKQRKLEEAQRELHAAVADERKRLLAQRAEVDKKLAELDALTGTKRGGTRRSGIRQEVLNAVKNAPQGIARAGLLDALGAQDKSSQQSISNALAALKKAGTIDQKDGKYISA